MKIITDTPKSSRRLGWALAAILAGLSITTLALSQQGGSGRPGGVNFSTQYRSNSSTFGGTGPGTAGHVLTSNGAASAPTFQAAPSSPPGGADTQVQYNDGGAFGGDAGLVFNETTNALTVGGDLLTSGAQAGVSTTGAAAVLTAASSNASASPQVALVRSAGTVSAWQIYAPTGSTELRMISGGADRLTLTAAGVLTAADVTATDDVIATDQVVAGVGSTAAPGIVLSNDADSGFYSPGPANSGNISWLRNGAAVFAAGTSVTVASPTGNLALSGASGVRSDSNTIIDPAGGTDELTVTDGLVAAGVLVTTPASTTTTAGLRLPHGAAPTSPVNGDMWTTTAGLFIQINGSTVGPLN